MAVFVVISAQVSPELRDVINTKFVGENWQIAENAWFVLSNGTAKDVSDSLGIKRGGITGVVVMRGSPMYYGVANTAMWDWLKSAIERSNNG